MQNLFIKFLRTAIYFVFKNLDLSRIQNHYAIAIDSDEVKVAMNTKRYETKIYILKKLLKATF